MDFGKAIDDQMKQRLKVGAVIVSMMMALVLGIYMCHLERKEDVVKARDMPTLGEQIKATDKFMAGIPKEEPELIFDKDGAKVYKVSVPGHGWIYVAIRGGGVAVTR